MPWSSAVRRSSATPWQGSRTRTVLIGVVMPASGAENLVREFVHRDPADATSDAFDDAGS